MSGTMQSRRFNLLAFSRYADAQLLICFCVLLMYLFSIIGNLSITALVSLVSHLHTPMYFFLCNLSVQDMIQVSAILPKLLVVTITHDSRISSFGCFTQMFLFVACVETGFVLLTSMAYDRYVAICMPLQYTVIMSNKICTLLATTSWLNGALNSLMFCMLMANLSFRPSQEINHFFCDLKTMLKLTCSDTTHILFLIFLEGVLLGIISFLLILASYVYIISSILKIHNSSGRLKSFSSCSSHLTIVLLLYGTCLTMYMKPNPDHLQEQDKLLSLLYIAIVPMLNPIIYSLRNKEVLRAIKYLLEKVDINIKMGPRAHTSFANPLK